MTLLHRHLVRRHVRQVLDRVGTVLPDQEFLPLVPGIEEHAKDLLASFLQRISPAEGLMLLGVLTEQVTPEVATTRCERIPIILASLQRMIIAHTDAVLEPRVPGWAVVRRPDFLSLS